jgi:hypothetical protein
MRVLVVGVDPEKLVLDERPARGEAVNLAQVLRLDVRLRLWRIGLAKVVTVSVVKSLKAFQLLSRS